MYDIDAALTQAINSLAGRSAAGDMIMLALTSLGVPLMVLAVALQWWRRSERMHTRHILVSAGCAFLLGLGINQIILLFIQRARPYEVGVTHLLIAPTVDFLPVRSFNRRLRNRRDLPAGQIASFGIGLPCRRGPDLRFADLCRHALR